MYLFQDAAPSAPHLTTGLLEELNCGVSWNEKKLTPVRYKIYHVRPLPVFVFFSPNFGYGDRRRNLLVALGFYCLHNVKLLSVTAILSFLFDPPKTITGMLVNQAANQPGKRGIMLNH